MTQLLEMTTITTDADTEIRTVLFDLGIRLYTPHREFILSEIFKLKLNLSLNCFFKDLYALKVNNNVIIILVLNIQDAIVINDLIL